MAIKKAKSRGPAKKRANETDITNEIFALKNPNEINIREDFPWTAKQKSLLTTALDKKTKIVMVRGPAGTSKTICAAYCALVCLRERGYKKITYIRVPIESSSAKLGFLPGDAVDKMNPYVLPLKNVLGELVGSQDLKSLEAAGALDSVSCGFIKGLGFSNQVVIADEAEDWDKISMQLLLGRFASKSLMFIIGDSKQSNIKDSSFDRVFNLFNDEESRAKGIHCFEFSKEDCMRSGITKYILEKLEV